MTSRELASQHVTKENKPWFPQQQETPELADSSPPHSTLNTSKIFEYFTYFKKTLFPYSYRCQNKVSLTTLERQSNQNWFSHSMFLIAAAFNTFFVISRGGGVYSLKRPIRGGSARKGYLFQASGIWKGRDFTRCSIWKSREICHLGLWKGPKGRTDKFYDFIKSGKRSIFVIDSYLNDNAFTAVKIM